jgi:hypothetical protein
MEEEARMAPGRALQVLLAADKKTLQRAALSVVTASRDRSPSRGAGTTRE